MLQKIIKKIKTADNGHIAALLNLLYFNFIKVNRFIIYEIDLSVDLEMSSLNTANVDFKVIHYEELKDYLPAGENPPSEFFMHEIDGVRHCVVALKNNLIAHISWLYLKGDKNRWFNLNDVEAQINYNYTFPEFRGKGLNALALMALARWLKQRNYQRLLIEVHEETHFMISSLKKVPAVKQIGLLSQWCFYRPKWSKTYPGTKI